MCSSCRWAVAVAVSRPTPRPVISRASSSTIREGSSRKSAAAASSSASPAMKTFLRPIQSETCPVSSRLASTPKAYTAKTIVTMNVENPTFARYSGYRGVGTVENAMDVRNAPAISQNPRP